jgi:hypothetical protein
MRLQTDPLKLLIRKKNTIPSKKLQKNGYTGVKELAGRYRQVDALGLDSVQAIHENDAPDYAPACWPETIVKHREQLIATLQATVERQAAEIARLKAESSRWHGQFG